MWLMIHEPHEQLAVEQKEAHPQRTTLRVAVLISPFCLAASEAPSAGLFFDKFTFVNSQASLLSVRTHPVESSQK